MTMYSQLIRELGETTGLPLDLDAKDACTLETEGLFVTLQYRRQQDDVALFAPVTDPETEGGPDAATLRAALALACHGQGTRGNFLGLFEHSLLLSTFVPLEGLNAERLGARLLAFTDAALAVRKALASPAADTEQVAVDAGIPANLLNALRV